MLKKNHSGKFARIWFIMALWRVVAAASPEKTEDGEVMLFPIVKDGKWGYMDASGQVVIESKYQLALDFYEGLACVGLNGLRGHIDKTGRMVIKPWFGWTARFSEGLAWVNLHTNKYGDHVEWYRAVTGTGYCDKEGNAKRFGGTRCDFSHGLIWVPALRGGGKYLDKEGKPMDFEGDEGSSFSDGMAAARKGSMWGYLSRETMKFAIQPRYEAARPFSDGLAAVATGGELDPKSKKQKFTWGYVDKTGTVVIEPKYEDAGPFSEGLAPVRVSGRWGYLERSGKLVIEPKYDYAWRFSGGMGRVLVGEKHGFIDKTGKFAIEPQYDVAWEFSKGLARVGVADKEGYIDKTGKYVWEPTE